MITFEEFRQELRGALAHLHDPDYLPSEIVCVVVGCDPRDGGGPVQAEIIRVIQGLEPGPGIAPDAQSRQDYDVLLSRFVLKLTQEQTAERLYMSVRSVRRAQRTATHMLARLFWDHSLVQEAAAEEPGLTAEGWSRSTSDWRSQVRQDLSSLQTRTAQGISDVWEAIHYAVKLEGVLASRHGIDLQLACPEPHPVAAIHPSVLRQVLIMVIAQLARCVAAGPIAIRAMPEGEFVQIALTASCFQGRDRLDGDLVREILELQGGSAQVTADRDQVTFSIRVPLAGKATVLVIDDNPDIVHFFGRCTTGTRYHVVHAAQGERTIAAIEAMAPDVIVLDILLPDVDGWELLSQLHTSPATRAIPIIICSIVREEELASTLGAVQYLPKPVHRQDFIRALDQALEQGQT